MQSDTVSIQKLFQDRRQYRVPFFQRPYVWNKEDQWERLWADILGKAEVRYAGDRPPPHFLGAAVLEPQPRVGLIGVETLHIIDGQQRFTTLQYFLSALAIVLRSHKLAAHLSIVESCLQNTNPDTMRDPEIEVFKVWPTFRDRETYRLAMSASSLDDLRERFPDSFTQSRTLKKIGIDHPPALEAIWYFADQVLDWLGDVDEKEANTRLNALTEAVLGDLQLVSISLGEQDDAQVIFETLNGHGAQLNATDLIRNFIFMRADREEKSSGKDLFESLWRQFEGGFWSEMQRRGRLLRPRLEWFFQTVLQSVLGDDVEISRLYMNYRRFTLDQKPPISASAQLQLLDENGANYRQLVTGVGSRPIALFGKRVAEWDASTTHSVALAIAASKLSQDAQKEMFDDLVAYLVRRAICGLTAKNYNKVFAQLLRKLKEGQLDPASLRAALAAQDGDASRWPGDQEFRNAWLTAPIYYGHLDASKIKSVLSDLEAGLRSPRSEEHFSVEIDSLDVDHILPTKWFEHWPLADGTYAKESEAVDARLADLTSNLTDRQIAITRRERMKITIGNLTLLHYGLNRGLQHREFALKREKMFAESNLHLNRALMRLDQWNEEAIADRGAALFEIARKIWKGPER